MEQLTTFLKDELQLPASFIPAVSRFYTLETFPKGQLLTSTGNYLQYMWLIQGGYLRFFTYGESKEVTHWIFGEGQFVTDVESFFFQGPSKWNIEALADTTLFSISFDAYQRLRREVPEWDQYEKFFLIKLMSALENRVYTLLSMSSEERYHYLLKAAPNMFRELPLQYLASMLGMTPETLSRIRRKSSS